MTGGSVIGMEIAFVTVTIASILFLKSEKFFDLRFVGTKRGMAWLETGQAGEEKSLDFLNLYFTRYK